MTDTAITPKTTEEVVYLRPSRGWTTCRRLNVSSCRVSSAALVAAYVLARKFRFE